MDLTGITILIADDEPDLRGILMTHFMLYGGTVLCAEDADKAFELFENQHIDLIISDVRMPGGGGMSLLRRVRERDPFSPPLIFITGYSDFDIEFACAQGAAQMISKPFKFKELEDAVVAALGLVS